MKSRKFLPIAVIVLMLPALFGCPSKNEPTPSGTDQQLTKLSKTWKCTAATLDNVAQTGYSTFTITVSGTAGQTTFNYTCANRATLSPWNKSGTFTFGTDFATQLTRDDSLPITYSVTDTQLQMTFNYNGAGFAGPRISNVKGNWVFTFAPQ
ncbi:MAG TPA: hypothetical protein VG737_10195 [Cyclobacteriaceae bacterium]|nr:hypothetical protein [Cyclobacteriaceae bacterium]